MSVPQLLSIASASVADKDLCKVSLPELGRRGERFRELAEMLATKNGFYAFQEALHVLPNVRSTVNPGVIGIEAWNEPELWKGWYLGSIDDVYCFAEDAFGNQFGIRGLEIVSFDAESGEVEPLAGTVEDWAAHLLVNYRQLTGAPIAQLWQQNHGPIPEGKRLLPKTPFILGGAYDLGNLYAVDAVKGMRYRGELWEQLRNLPDGAQVRLKALPLQ